MWYDEKGGERMKCPYCVQEMTKGYLQSARKIFFTEKRHKFMFEPYKEDLEITEHNWTAPTAEAWRCSFCGKIIVEYRR